MSYYTEISSCRKSPFSIIWVLIAFTIPSISAEMYKNRHFLKMCCIQVKWTKIDDWLKKAFFLQWKHRREMHFRFLKTYSQSVNWLPYGSPRAVLSHEHRLMPAACARETWGFFLSPSSSRQQIFSPYGSAADSIFGCSVPVFPDRFFLGQKRKFHIFNIPGKW